MMNHIKSHLSSFDELPAVAFVRQRTVEALFACSAATVWRWVHKGIIPTPKKIGGATLWNVGELRETLNTLKGA